MEYTRIAVDKGCRLENGFRTMHIHHPVEFLAQWVGGFWTIPMGDYTWTVLEGWKARTRMVGKADVCEAAASDANTIVLTCRECGGWLKPTDTGWGTDQGWCGCEERE